MWFNPVNVLFFSIIGDLNAENVIWFDSKTNSKIASAGQKT